MRVQITKAGSSPTKKDGTPLKDKKGNPYFLSWIQTQEHGSQFIRGFTYQDVKQWEGKSIDLDIFEEEYQGKKQLKFRIPEAWKLTKEMWEVLVQKVEQLERAVQMLAPKDEDEINPNDID